ncbi:MgtC/SapB family protein [Sphingomonas lutea]|uniref:MgtC/SapB family protein n=1 Tax=Sphingomonas lutea TaxID=1045317 RepID=A0A7G9SJZ3_9SPHN|nr:MgtC/SapB family protein [Sphingomonas lutea]QNN68168.1 MgtC/SapB family protein [Sphingomonas lutea]
MIPGLEPWAQEALGAGVGLAIGALVGLERGFKLRDQKAGTRVAGVRTFSLMGLAAGIAGVIAHRQPLAAAAVLLAMLGYLAIAYAPRLTAKGDATSPIAAAATTAAAFLAGLGSIGLALATAAVIVFILALKDDLHEFVDRLDKKDIHALARYGIIALAVLPFLPDQPMGPYGAWNPSKLWWVVVLVTGFSFAGYVANRIFGARHGTIATALIGGAYSSTAVTQSLSQRLGSGEGGGAEPAGIALASAVMYLRVIVLVAILANRILIPFVLLLAPALIIAWVAGWWLYRKAEHSDAPIPPGNPIALKPALGFLAFVAIAAVVARWAQGTFGEQGIAVLLFLMGSMDVDASIVTAGGLPPQSIGAALAAIAIGGTIIANMAVKIGVVLSYAKGKGTSAALALLASTLVLAGSIAVAWMRL